MAKDKNGCDCCDDLSDNAKSVLNEINSLLDPNAGKGTDKGSADDDSDCIKEFAKSAHPVVDTPNDKERVLKDLKVINSALSGAIGDIVGLIETFFSVDFDSLDISKIQADENTKDTASDNPTIDISKVLPDVDLKSFKDLKMSVTVPAVNLAKTISIGPISVKLGFAISTKEITWGPTVDAKFDTPEKALAGLAGAKVKDILRPSSGKKLAELKALAKKQITNNSALLQSLLAAKTVDEFFAILAAANINLFDEIDLAEVAKKLYNNNLEAAKQLRTS